MVLDTSDNIYFGFLRKESVLAQYEWNFVKVNPNSAGTSFSTSSQFVISK